MVALRQAGLRRGGSVDARGHALLRHTIPQPPTPIGYADQVRQLRAVFLTTSTDEELARLAARQRQGAVARGVGVFRIHPFMFGDSTSFLADRTNRRNKLCCIHPPSTAIAAKHAYKQVAPVAAPPSDGATEHLDRSTLMPMQRTSPKEGDGAGPPAAGAASALTWAATPYEGSPMRPRGLRAMRGRVGAVLLVSLICASEASTPPKVDRRGEAAAHVTPPTQTAPGGTWTGLERPPSQPLQCGLLWFLHIGKTGGSTITTHLHGLAKMNNFTFLHLYSIDFTKNWSQWNSTEAAAKFESPLWQQEHESCRRFPTQRGCIERVAAGWQQVLHELQTASQPRVIVSQHHASVGFGEYMLDGVLRPLRSMLEAKGCQLITSTVLREPKKLTLSSLAYELQGWYEGERAHAGAPGDRLGRRDDLGQAPESIDDGARALAQRWITRSAQQKAWGVADSLGFKMCYYLQYSHHPREERRSWLASQCQRLARAFDLVGRTEELGTFLAVVDGMFTNNEPQLEVENPTDRMYTSSISKAVAELKWSIHDEEQNLMGDELLYSSFCRQPPRVVRIASRNVSVSSRVTL